MPYTEAQKRATAKYNAKAYDRIEIKVAKGRKAEIQAFAESRGESVNAFVTRLIDQAMEAGENHKEYQNTAVESPKGFHRSVLVYRLGSFSGAALPVGRG